MFLGIYMESSKRLLKDQKIILKNLNNNPDILKNKKEVSLTILQFFINRVFNFYIRKSLLW